MSDPTFLATQNPHVRDEDIVFDEGPHIYYLKGKRVSISVTTFVHKFFPHFNANKIATMTYRKHFKNSNSKYFNKTVDEIKEMWEINRDEAAQAGTKMHRDIELFYNNEPIDNTSIEFSYFKNFYEDFPELKAYRTEWVVYHEEFDIAGSIDMIYKNEDGTLSIYDWKRSKEIVEHNGYENGAPPLDHISHCNYYHYALQLNTYKYILENKYDQTVKELCLIVLHPNNENYRRYELPDLQEEVKAMFNHQ